jgi:hypothetical protein
MAPAITKTRVTPSTTAHGRGEIGGKGEGLVILDQHGLGGIGKLRTEIITTEFYDRYRDNNDEFDPETLERLRQIHAAFPDGPIGVRSSERFENDPLVPTSGQSCSYMLPNSHGSPEARFASFRRAIENIYEKFFRRTAEDNVEGNTLAILVNPIPGISTRTNAGSFFYPMSSGVADSFFAHPLTLDSGPQDPGEGFARVAVGHGYAVVLDAFEVLPLATIKQPLPPRLMTQTGQSYFYAIQLDEGVEVDHEEMSTMSMLHKRFLDPRVLKVFADEKGCINFDDLVTNNRYNYKRDLDAIMEQLHKLGSDFQIEFTWNLVDGEGVFHIVQYKRLRTVDSRRILVPEVDEHAVVSTDQFQGHNVIKGIRYAIVINPFNYKEEMHDHVLAELKRWNDELESCNEQYVFVCPGRLGTKNRKWGFFVEYPSISGAAAIVEYGYDIKGSPSIEVDPDELSGGIYGSHFLFQVLGGANEAERARRARLFGSQGTHFLTNLYTSGAIYMFVNPTRNLLSHWFFTAPEGHQGSPIYPKKFEEPQIAYANLYQRRSMVTRTSVANQRSEPRKGLRRPKPRVINPQKMNHVFVFAASAQVREAAERVRQHLPYCKPAILSDPAALTRPLHDRAFVLLIDDGGMPFFDREEFRRNNPFGSVVLLSHDLAVGSAPTNEEVERVCPLARRADEVFYVNDRDCAPSRVVPAAIRYVEDRHNIEFHKRAKRFIFLVVDDELRWFSQFLPVLYRIIGLRASVMIARTFEEAMAILDEHGSDVVCLITDMLFPKGGVVTADAGRELVISTKKSKPRIPIIIASKARQGMSLQDFALILPKGDPDAVEILDRYVHDFTGLGDFLFFDDGDVWRRATTLKELREAIADAPIGMLEEYAAKDYFSTWLYMHGFRRLADRLRTRRDVGKELKKVLLAALEKEIEIVREQELMILNERKEIVGRAKTVRELVEAIKTIGVRTLQEYSASDVFSMWLMIKGYPVLADKIRPIHGEGEELRRELIETFEVWLAERRDRRLARQHEREGG